MADGVVREDEGGESACFAHLTCPECGDMLDGSDHSTQCHREQRESGFVVTDAISPQLNA